MRKNIAIDLILIIVTIFIISNNSINAFTDTLPNKSDFEIGIEKPKNDFDIIENNFLENMFFNIKLKTYMKIIDAPSITACVIKNNSIIWSGSYGFSNIYRLEKARLQSIYVIGSDSKTITSTAIMQLYEKGLIGLDDNINDYIPFEIVNPHFPEENITIRMLLAHQSSLCDTWGTIPSFLKYLDNRSKWIKERVTPGGSQYHEDYWNENNGPGIKNHYSNIGYIIISYLVELISGQDFEDYCQKHIFIPLEMHNTSFQRDSLNQALFARPYYPLFSKYFLPLPNYDLGCAAACGGLRTTMIDLSHFLIAHMNGGVWNSIRLLNESTIEQMHEIQYPNETLDFYSGEIQHGLGWIHIKIFGSEWEGNNGGAIGYLCNMAIRKKDNIGFIMCSNGHFLRPIPGFPITTKLSIFRLSGEYKLANLLIGNALSINT